MGVDESQVTVSNVSKNMYGMKYTANIGGQMYNCSIIGGNLFTFGQTPSAPECVQVSSKAPKKTQPCNPMLKAAGKCKK